MELEKSNFMFLLFLKCNKKGRNKMNKIVKRIIIGVMIAILLISVIILGINFWVISKTKNKIITQEQSRKC